MQLKKFLLFGLLAAVLPAFAEEVADRKTATSLKYVEHELDTRQNKFTAEQNKAMEYTNTAGSVQKRAVTSDLDNGGTDSLPMVGGVNTKLATKQDDIAAINDHTAVTYTGQPGGIGQKGIYQTTESYADQSDNLIDAKTFNAALKRGLDSEFLCSEYKPGTDLCWVWSIHNNEANGNLFDKTTIRTNAYINPSGAVTSDGTNRTVVSANIPVKPNTTYTFSGMGNLYNATYYRSGFQYKADDTPIVAIAQTTGTPVTFTTDEECAYIKVIVVTANVDTAQVEEGANVTERPYTTLVPSGYTPVEWIATSGTPYIDTGIVGRSGISVKAKFMLNTLANGALFGNRMSTETRFFPMLWFATSSGPVRWDTAVNSDNYGDPILTNTMYIAHFTSSASGFALDVNGYRMLSGSSVGTNTNNLWMFGVNNNGNLQYPFNGKMFFANIWQGDTLVREYIPARRNNDNVVGVYDRVSNTFFTYSGADGTFIAGPDIPNNVYVPQNQ